MMRWYSTTGIFPSSFGIRAESASVVAVATVEPVAPAEFEGVVAGVAPAVAAAAVEPEVLSPLLVQQRDTNATRAAADMRLNIEPVKQWWKIEKNRRTTILVALATSILAVATLDGWL